MLGAVDHSRRLFSAMTDSHVGAADSQSDAGRSSTTLLSLRRSSGPRRLEYRSDRSSRGAVAWD